MSIGLSKRDFAKMFSACPKCGAGPGVRCLRANGKKRVSIHRERMTAKVDTFKLDRVAPGGFYQTEAWRKLRYGALVTSGGRCQACGAKPFKGKSLHVDHIKPRARYPDLALDAANLQVLCEDCNIGKGASDTTDWRAS